MKNDLKPEFPDIAVSRRFPSTDVEDEGSFSSADRDAIFRLIHARRDIREFVSDPIPERVLWQILDAAHAAPSVGLSQPWRFVVIESRAVRESVKADFIAVNEEQQKLAGNGERGELYRSLKLEGILESALNLAVVCDPGARQEFVLGRAPMPETAPYSVCLAIENLWLAARAEGIGVGWVSILEKDRLKRLLKLPDRVELIAYLCLGYPKQFRGRPMLEEAGWKQRDELESRVYRNAWGEPYDWREIQSELNSPAKQLPPDFEIPWGDLARQKIDKKTKPPGSLGKLEAIAIHLAEIQQTLEPAVAQRRILVFAANHGITAAGVSPYPSVVTGQMVANFLEGGAAINVLARHGGIDLKIIDAGVGVEWTPEQKENADFAVCPVRAGTRNFLNEPAMTPEECDRALEIGREQVHTAIAHGVQLLGIGEMGIGNSTSASALAAALLNLTPEQAAGRGTGATDAIFQKKQQVIADALKKHATGNGSQETTARHWLEAVGGFEIAAMTGAILEASKQRCPIVIDGFIATAATLVAFKLDPDSRSVCFFAHCSHEFAHSEVLRRLGVEPILQLDMRLGEGTGAALAMPVIAAAAKIFNEMATFKSAGVSDRTEEAGA